MTTPLTYKVVSLNDVNGQYPVVIDFGNGLQKVDLAKLTQSQVKFLLKQNYPFIKESKPRKPKTTQE